MHDETTPELNETLLVDVLCSHFRVPREEVRPTSTFAELGLDSLAVMEWVVMIQERTGQQLLDRLGSLSVNDTLDDAVRLLRTAPVASASAG
ncbi:acyl carrier protein [Kitasatospora viridis]|uniref:Phosphopantetheine binding protein n=1 Tax=Kitasatospora viridis TaxID=281105 RepID=A0A561TW14_9ACTN|nr:acyl carrier protein [Kitasatospora viridis]TWF91306.1 phosphopantetheine binding protein [Kitasatospora viridis]